MDSLRNPRFIFWRCLHSGWGRAAVQLCFGLMLALLFIAPAGAVATPQARTSQAQRPEGALVRLQEVQRSKAIALTPLHLLLTLHTAETLKVRYSTGAGGACHTTDMRAIVQAGDTLGGIATRYGTTWGVLASYNHLSNPNLIFPQQTLCIPTSASHTGQSVNVSQTSATTAQVGQTNLFPYGQCTWWANQRYHQLHGVYVPWATQSDAWQWTARARDFGWVVSSSPQVGDIIDLQPWIQGAYGLGHMAIVERILSNGHVIASNMHWGATPGMVVNVEFAPGAGVTFIRL